MRGHTDRATINQRKPMSEGMVKLLRQMATAAVDQGELWQAEKSQARGLMDRGYAMPDSRGWWSATPAGRVAVLSGEQRARILSLAPNERMMGGFGTDSGCPGLIQAVGINHPVFGSHYQLTILGIQVWHELMKEGL